MPDRYPLNPNEATIVLLDRLVDEGITLSVPEFDARFDAGEVVWDGDIPVIVR